ncbi:MBL fold metallo-hydrolase [Singulisphaera sp. PoT]|uniref:MBL fold metallo-hydrolase n=1 Tax=Singulisphaera sp. PoT TaxID=3411797 RepID=UPI003BF5849C
MRETSMAAAAMGTLATLGATGGAAQSPPDGTPYLCVTCGTQFKETPKAPEHCPICEDERQYVGPEGQQWTTLEKLRTTHKNTIKKEEEHLYSINTEPKFGIGQRAFLIQTPRGNLLWDCVGLIDDATIAQIKELGGIAEIAISHPHYYTAMVEWSRAFGNAPIHIHEAERPWVMRPDPSVHFWKGEKQTLLGSLPLIRTGGHFEGYQVLLWPAGAGGRGALMAGDQPQICMDPKQVSFMWSYPNYIPLNATTIRQVMSYLEPLEYDRIYGAFFVRGKGIVPTNGKEVARRSADRYLKAIQG